MGKHLKTRLNIISIFLVALSSSQFLFAGVDGKEMNYWESIRNKKALNDYQNYLKYYPNGLYAQIAQENIRRLSIGGVQSPSSEVTPTMRVASLPESSSEEKAQTNKHSVDALEPFGQEKEAEFAYWDSIKNKNSVVLFQIYLIRYPQGLYVKLAKHKIKQLQ